jgi:hypothetical protein
MNIDQNRIAAVAAQVRATVTERAQRDGVRATGRAIGTSHTTVASIVAGLADESTLLAVAVRLGLVVPAQSAVSSLPTPRA